MSRDQARIVVVASDERLGRRLSGALERRGHEPVLVATGEAAVEEFSSHGASAVLIVLPLQDMTGPELASELRSADANALFIMTGADRDVRSAIDAFDLGAYEYLETVGEGGAQLLSVIGRAVGSRREDLRLRYLHQKDAPPAGLGVLGAKSAAMQNVASVLRQVCRRSSKNAPTILLRGETGTGKGFVARWLHYNMVRRNQAFIAVNCAALPASLIESELFGYERGAFTDAKSGRPGLFEAADGGTLFLDEIGAVPLDLQAKLLTAIEEKKVRRVGGRQAANVDIQIIAATHEDLESRVKEGGFRSDLYHRLNVVSVVLPPLRERGDDVLVLAESFVESICREYGMPPRPLTDGARVWIRRYSWPGNIRELRNRLERIILLENDEVIRAEHFGVAPSAPPNVHVTDGPSGVHVSLPEEGVSLEELERAVLGEALARCHGNVSRAARFLSISRQTLIYRMKKHGLGTRVFSGKGTDEAPESGIKRVRKAAIGS